MRQVRINAESEPDPGPPPVRFVAFEDYLLWRDVGLRGRFPDGQAGPVMAGTARRTERAVRGPAHLYRACGLARRRACWCRSFRVSVPRVGAGGDPSRRGGDEAVAGTDGVRAGPAGAGAGPVRADRARRAGRPDQRRRRLRARRAGGGGAPGRADGGEPGRWRRGVVRPARSGLRAAGCCWSRRRARWPGRWGCGCRPTGCRWLRRPGSRCSPARTPAASGSASACR